MREKDFQAKVLPKLRAIPGSWWVKTNDRTTAGVPDILGCIGPIFVAIELKTLSKLSELQFVILEKINRCGAISLVITPENIQEMLVFLSSLVVNPPRLPAHLKRPARMPDWVLPPTKKKNRV